MRLTEVEKQQYLKDKEKNLNIELNTLKKKQEGEVQALNMKIQQVYGEFKRNRALEVQTMLMKYKNRYKEMADSQRKELAKYESLLNDTDKKSKYIYIIFI